MASLHFAVSEVVPAGKTYESAVNTTVPSRVAKPRPFLYTCHKCDKHYIIRKRMETHQQQCVGKTTNAKSRRNACNATTSIMPNVHSVHIGVAAKPCAGTSCQKIQNLVQVYYVHTSVMGKCINMRSDTVCAIHVYNSRTCHRHRRSSRYVHRSSSRYVYLP
jgi:hypothetical protein